MILLIAKCDTSWPYHLISCPNLHPEPTSKPITETYTSSLHPQHTPLARTPIQQPQPIRQAYTKSLHPKPKINPKPTPPAYTLSLPWSLHSKPSPTYLSTFLPNLSNSQKYWMPNSTWNIFQPYKSSTYHSPWHVPLSRESSPDQSGTSHQGRPHPVGGRDPGARLSGCWACLPQEPHHPSPYGPHSEMMGKTCCLFGIPVVNVWLV